jgi:hypothetical protein
MTPVVKAKLDSILTYPFFSAVGQPLPSAVSSVNTWPKAAKTCGFVKWSNSQLQAGNALHARIVSRYPEDRDRHYFWHRSQEWNPLCQELRPVIVSFVRSLVRELPLNDNDRKKVSDNINWDLLSICLEAHYQDIVKPIFYIPYLEPWYAAGHFPCGWDGDEFPEEWDGVIRGGQLIVF